MWRVARCGWQPYHKNLRKSPKMALEEKHPNIGGFEAPITLLTAIFSSDNSKHRGRISQQLWETTTNKSNTNICRDKTNRLPCSFSLSNMLLTYFKLEIFVLCETLVSLQDQQKQINSSVAWCILPFKLFLIPQENSGKEFQLQTTQTCLGRDQQRNKKVQLSS